MVASATGEILFFVFGRAGVDGQDRRLPAANLLYLVEILWYKRRTRRSACNTWRVLDIEPLQEAQMPDKPICSIEGCGKPRRMRGWCSMHYYRWRAHGDPLKVQVTYASADQQIDFIEKYIVLYEGEECLAWPFSHDPKGRATLYRGNGKRESACQVICTLAHGNRPSSRHVSAHRCGRGHEGCVNPKHLRWATQKENAADRDRHLTTVRGEEMWCAKLTVSDVRQIRSLGSTVSQRQLSKRYNVSIPTIRCVLTGKTWKHVL